MKSISALLFISLALAGCSTTNRLTSPQQGNSRIGTGSAVLRLKAGETFKVHRMRFDTDSVICYNSATDSLMCFSLAEIKSVRITQHGGGALEGLMVGGLVGTGLGLLQGTKMGSGGEAQMGKAGALFTGMVVGGGTGLILGALKGRDYIFLMPMDTLVTEAEMSRSPNDNAP